MAPANRDTGIIHLSHSHHWIIITAEIVSDALPRIPRFREAASATRTLTELSADDNAARQCGADAVTGALLALGKPERSTALRLRALRAATARRPKAAASVVDAACYGVVDLKPVAPDPRWRAAGGHGHPRLLTR